MTVMPPKSKKLLKYHWNLKDDQITKIPHKTYKMTERPLKSNKWPKHPQNLYLQDQNDKKKKKLYNHSTCFPPDPKSLGRTYNFLLSLSCILIEI